MGQARYEVLSLAYMAEEDSENRCPSNKSLINARDNPLSTTLPCAFGLDVLVLLLLLLLL